MRKFDHPAVPRTAAVCIVVAAHLLLLVFLRTQAAIRRPSSRQVSARLVIELARPSPEPPVVQAPHLEPPDILLPLPDVEVNAPVVRTVPLQSMPHAPAPAPAGHFAASTDAGLGLDVATVAGGGAGSRGTLAGFEAAVRRRILAGKRQPDLAWDRRNTCVVSYTVHIGADGRLSGFSLDACAVPEINDAARAAIRQAAYPRPPELGASNYEVHGSLVFRP